MISDLKLDIYSKNKEGETALDICRKQKKTKQVELLERLGKSESIAEVYKADMIAKQILSGELNLDTKQEKLKKKKLDKKKR